MNGVTTRAVASGADRPRNCGTSSPTTIEKAVASTSAMATASGSTAPSGRPTAPSGPSSRLATLGSTRKPTSRVVSVMPTCDADSWVDSAAQRVRTCWLRWSPSSTARSTVARSSVM